MNRFWETHRWFRITLSVVAIPAGLLVMWVGGQWTIAIIVNVLELPDTGGHGLEFLILFLAGIGVALFGGGTAATNIYALAMTKLFKRPIDELQVRTQMVTRVAYVTSVFVILIVAAIGIWFLVMPSLIRPLLWAARR